MGTETFIRIKAIIVDHLGLDPKQVTPDASFVDDLGADSLDEFELIFAIEDEFDVYVEDEALENVRTVGDAVSLIDGVLS